MKTATQIIDSLIADKNNVKAAKTVTDYINEAYDRIPPMGICDTIAADKEAKRNSVLAQLDSDFIDNFLFGII